MALSLEERATLLDVAMRVADAARAPALSRFRSAALAVDDKGETRFDPVTEADRLTEAAMRETLRRLRPRDSVMGEEFAAVTGDSGVTWVLDPIDGTRAYIAGAPTWGVLIAANDGDGPVVGVMDQPFTQERFVGVAPDRAHWSRGDQRRPLRTRACPTLAQATLLSTFPEIGDPGDRAGFEAVRDAVRMTRYGLDCYGYALVALGCADLVIEAGLHAYDIQPMRAIIEAAGGVVTDWRGASCDHGGRVLAAGDPRAHAAALAILRAY